MFYAVKIGFWGIFAFFIFMAIPNFVGSLIEKFIPKINKIAIPIDMLMMRFIEIFSSIPSILLILTIVAIRPPSIYILMSVIGLTRWTGIARFTRAELLRVRNLEYMEAAQSLGFSELRSIFRHALPNSLAPVLIAIAFGVASAILTEAGLSFIGIGVEPGLMTWGKLLNMARSNFEAWWLALIPGFAIFITVTIYNLIGEGLTDALDPKMKQ
jgi:peptide/nickel transport system permease protein